MEYFSCDKYTLGLRELKNDLIYSKIPSDLYKELIDFAWETGCKKAKDCIIESNTTVPTDIVKKLNITVIDMDNSFAAVEYRILSEYYSNSRKIVLYKNAIMNEILKWEDKVFFECKDYSIIREIFIAHEIFHHLECYEIGLTSKKKKIRTLKIGPLEITSGIRALSEIGAHGFTKTLLNL